MELVLNTPDPTEEILRTAEGLMLKVRTSNDTMHRYLLKFKRPLFFDALIKKYGTWGLDEQQMDLMVAGYGAHHFEEIFCEKLYRNALSANGICNHLIDFLAEHGGVASLNMMKVVQYELTPKLKSLAIAVESIRSPDEQDGGLAGDEITAMVTYRAYKDREKRLGNAINLLCFRELPDHQNLHDAHDSRRGSTTKQVQTREQRIDSYLQKSRDFIPDHPAESLNNMRKAAEAICKDVLDAACFSGTYENAIPGKSFKSLEDMIKRIHKDHLVPSDVELCLSSLQSFGNHASHDQDACPERMTHQLAESTLGHLQTAVDWYRQQSFQFPDQLE